MNNLGNLNTAMLGRNNTNSNKMVPAGSAKEAHATFTKKITVDMLSKKNTVDDFDSRVLLNSVHERKKKLNECYTAIYKKCCEQIKSADKLLFTHIEYIIPIWSEYHNYNCKDCIEFIKNKLEEQKINVSVITQTKLYISWHDLEQKVADEINSAKSMKTTKEINTNNLHGI